MQRFWPILFFLALSVSIMGPLYAPGYLFLLDMVWGPHLFIDFSQGWGPSTPLLTFLNGLTFVLPSSLVQKLVLTGILTLGGWGMYSLARLWVSPRWAVVSGVLFVCNPFILERFGAGQWLATTSRRVVPIS